MSRVRNIDPALHNANGLYYWDDGQATDALKIGGFGPDVPFGFGTSGERIQSALKSYGRVPVILLQDSY